MIDMHNYIHQSYMFKFRYSPNTHVHAYIHICTHRHVYIRVYMKSKWKYIFKKTCKPKI